MATYVKAIIYTAVAVWAVVLLVSGQKLSSDLLRPLSTVTSVVVLLSIAFELWLWKISFLHSWLVKRPVLTGTWRAELRSNWKDASGTAIPPVEGYVVIRQTFFNLSLRLLTKESSSHLVGTEIVCSVDGLYCVSGVYRNEPRYQDRSHSEIHFGAVWLQVIDTPTQMLQGHYWTDRNTAGEMQLTDRQKDKGSRFQIRAGSLRAIDRKETLRPPPERIRKFSMDDERIILDWQDVNHESGRWADRWDYNLALYSILHPDKDEVLYLGKADGSTVRSRWNADDKHERVWSRIEDERGLFEHGFIVGESGTQSQDLVVYVR